MTLLNVSLNDKYTLDDGRAFMTGVQALVRLPLMQRRADLAAGLNTGGFISGYRGSPLGTYDQQLWAARKILADHHIHFEPGVNEDLAATAVWGSQQLNLAPGAEYDGVFGIWYGKGPGVDRCGDVFRHANFAGTDKNGGVLVICGDDHNAVSSTVPHQSDHQLAHVMMPMLYPANVQEYLDYGLLGWAMSRYAGVWVGFKCVSEIVESSASVSLDPARARFNLPDDFDMPEGGLSIRWPDDRWEQEERLQRYKVYAALAFARANKIDRTIIDAPNPRIGIVTSGKSYLDLRQALDDLGIDDAMAAAIGLSVYKVGMTWPLEKEGIRHFAEGLTEVLVVEEKRALIENQMREQLYNWRADVRPRVVGKFDENGEWLLPAHGELTPSMIAKVVVDRIKAFHTSPAIQERMALLQQKERQAEKPSQVNERIPYFCSGCPHNSSTKVPEGSRSMAGIGCHYMSLWMNRNTETFTHMGGEGVPWLGVCKFTKENHIFANLGDGTFHHSGSMAIRAAVAAGANITYKILYNDAVAMTGGQPVLKNGQLTPWDISQMVHYEGVKKIIVTTDEPEKYSNSINWAPGVTIRHRDDLDAVQKELRQTPGCTVLIHDQTCAAEKRRRRKRGTFPDPDRRVFINDAVCEDCGDCSVQSNCVSVEPKETALGIKRQINQSACNKDFSCLKGFCPSFVTVSGARPAKLKGKGGGILDAAMEQLPAPATAPSAAPYNIIITGIGGTGVITLGALLGMAAHLEGKGVSVLDFTGLAQKNGAVLSHIRVADDPRDLHAVRVTAGTADLLLGCDMLVAAGKDTLVKLDKGKTRAIVNSHMVPTAEFTLDPTIRFDSAAMRDLIRRAVGDNLTDFIDASQLATALIGDAIAANLFLLGYAMQRGLLPVSLEALSQAIELNGVAVAMNKKALDLGRLAAHDLPLLEGTVKSAGSAPKSEAPALDTLDAVIEHRSQLLTQYQNAAYAASYREFVGQVRRAEHDRSPGKETLSMAVAHNLHKLMAYKDEYEVARLHSHPDFMAKLRRQFDGDLKISFHLAPPIISRRDPESGELKKREFGPWILPAFGLLARLKGLRGGPWDVFGRTEERRAERQWIGKYRTIIEELLTTLDPDKHLLAVEIARIPEAVKGYGHVKERNRIAAEARLGDLLQAWRSPEDVVAAAE